MVCTSLPVLFADFIFHFRVTENSTGVLLLWVRVITETVLKGGGGGGGIEITGITFGLNKVKSNTYS